ncbi:MAG: hypothetical protein ACK587_05155 [Cyanobacteriota bacterium]|jgi:hypothetical protein
MSFWTPALDPANPLIGSHPERYVLRLQAKDGVLPESETFLGLNAADQSIQEVDQMEAAHKFRTHEAALRAANELNRLGRGPLDVVKVGDP